MKKIIYVILFFIGICYIHPQNRDLAVSPDDLLIEENADGGFHLWIRAKDGIGSVMITESTADPEKKNAVYALRARERNEINGFETRILDGREMSRERGLYFLIDSTPEANEKLGPSFHIFIPYVCEFGYPWSRNGEIYISAGTFLNIRSFAKKYGDYSGPFLDNPYILDIVQIPVAVKPEGNYMKETLDNFAEIADRGGGEIVYSESSDKLIEDVGRVIGLFDGPAVDIVFAIDTTESMRNDFEILKNSFAKMLSEKTAGYEKARVGMVYYKDYSEDYLTKPFPFTEDMDVIKNLLYSAKPWGGKDRPEAVYEALYECVKGYPWEADDRIVILIGDAPAHLKPKGLITKDMVFAAAGEAGISIYTIILPP